MEQQEGSFAYENWQASIQDAPSQGVYEFPLFTDVQISGDALAGYGPYQFLNTVPINLTSILAPAIVLRLEDRVEDDFGFSGEIKTDVRRYHGGLLQDEIAALVSLCLGIKLKSGGCTREFRDAKEPRGRPIAHYFRQDPILPTRRENAPVLPRLVGGRSLDQIAPVKNFPLLSPAEAVALVRAARQYQEAVWIADTEPQLTWLMLVSAIETAAGHWRSSEDSPIERMRASKPELEPLLRTAGGDQFVEQVAGQIADYMGAVKKFTDFILMFLPDPPEDRPTSGFQVPWDKKSLKKPLQKIYSWRSRALHGGTPFPWPMCLPPSQMEGAFIEKPIGFGTFALGASWAAKDIPMLLHTFEYIVRKSLLNWLLWMSTEASHGH